MHDETLMSRDRKNKSWREQTAIRARSLGKGRAGMRRLSEHRARRQLQGGCGRGCAEPGGEPRQSHCLIAIIFCEVDGEVIR